MKKILSYNVNGIRAAFNKGFIEWLQEENPDVLCIQETKAQPEQIDTAAFEELGYKCYWYSAQKKGYSGVGIVSKEEPINVVYGIDNDLFDNEGRVIRADFKDFSVFSVYTPSGTTGGPRQDYKMEFIKYFGEYLNNLLKENPNLIIAGDYNICHKPIDINNPKNKKDVSGFLPEEREWFDQYLEYGFFDSLRKFDQRAERYSWWTYRGNCRARNVGWRIDYHIVSDNLNEKTVGADILVDVAHSDHCPISVMLDL